MSKPPANDNQAERQRRPCPICGRPETPEHRPFCSARCADVDLNRWLSGGYAIPTQDPVDDDEDGG